MALDVSFYGVLSKLRIDIVTEIFVFTNDNKGGAGGPSAGHTDA
jgi:hypothetical protein